MIGHSWRTLVLRVLLGGLSASSPALTPEITNTEKLAATRLDQADAHRSSELPITSELPIKD